MGRDWIIDVLADLRSFARDNDLPLLTAQLDEARLVAEVEIASHPIAEPVAATGDFDAAERTHPQAGSNRRL
ncbi:hypothetical protein [Yoonia sp.]|uniref:hypothetical protein n=1 Tax=Yoonia sp. TaxID=2212373 RepID=UPI00358F8271